MKYRADFHRVRIAANMFANTNRMVRNAAGDRTGIGSRQPVPYLRTREFLLDRVAAVDAREVLDESLDYRLLGSV